MPSLVGSEMCIRDRCNLARGHKTATASYMLQRGFTTTQARCWAALYGVGCLECPRCKIGLCLERATSSRHVFSCLGKRRAHSGRHCQSLTVVPSKSLRRSGFIGRAWPNFPSFYSTFQKNPTKKFLRYRRCAIHARFVAVSYWDFHVFMIPRHNGDRASPSPGAPFHAPRAPLPPGLF